MDTVLNMINTNTNTNKIIIWYSYTITL
jgi:hypothetical protein